MEDSVVAVMGHPVMGSVVVVMGSLMLSIALETSTTTKTGEIIQIFPSTNSEQPNINKDAAALENQKQARVIAQPSVTKVISLTDIIANKMYDQRGTITNTELFAPAVGSNERAELGTLLARGRTRKRIRRRISSVENNTRDAQQASGVSDGPGGKVTNFIASSVGGDVSQRNGVRHVVDVGERHISTDEAAAHHKPKQVIKFPLKINEDRASCTAQKLKS